MLNVLADKVRYVKPLLNEHSTTILTGVGVAGTIATAYLSGKASFKAAHLLEQAKEESLDNDNVAVLHELTPMSKVKVVWKLYVAPVGVGAVTITAIILAHKISAKRIAALTIAAGISDRALHEYREKIEEKLGKSKARAFNDEIAQDRINANPANSELIAVGTGEVLCYDQYTGRYFTSTAEAIQRAENEINYELLHFGSASLSEFFDKIGLGPTTYSDLHGWNSNHLLEVTISTTKTPDNRPCLAIDFKNPPIADYSREPYA